MMDRIYLRTLPVRAMRRLLEVYGFSMNTHEKEIITQEIVRRECLNAVKAVAAIVVVGILGIFVYHTYF